MSEDQYKYNIVVDTSEADSGFDSLIDGATQADASLGRVVEVLEQLERHLQTLNETASGASSGFSDIVLAINTWGEKLDASIGGVVEKLGSVQSTISRVGRESRNAASASAEGWGQAATAVEKYGHEVTQAERELAVAQRYVEQVASKFPDIASVAGRRVTYPESIKRTVGDLFPSKEELDRAVSAAEARLREIPKMYMEPGRTAELTQAERTPEAERTAEQARLVAEYTEKMTRYQAAVNEQQSLQYTLLAAESREAQNLLTAYEMMAEAEGDLATMTQLEAKARERLNAQVREQAALEAEIESKRVAAAPEGRLAQFFTESAGAGTSDVSKVFPEATGFEQSMLKVLTEFDKLGSTFQDVGIVTDEVMGQLRAMTGIRFQPLGASIRVNLTKNLSEAAASATWLSGALYEIAQLEMPADIMHMVDVLAPLPRRERGKKGYQWGTDYALKTAKVKEPTPAPAPAPEVQEEAEEVVATVEEMVAESNTVLEKIGIGVSKFLGGFRRLRRGTQETADELVNKSIIPDMVNAINEWLSLIDTDQVTDEIRAMVDKITELLTQLNVTLSSPVQFGQMSAFDWSTFWDQQETMTLFHGTSADRLPSIKEKGLQLSAEGHTAGNIYLTPDPAHAYYYSKKGGEVEYGRGDREVTLLADRVILQVKVPSDIVSVGPYGTRHQRDEYAWAEEVEIFQLMSGKKELTPSWMPNAEYTVAQDIPREWITDVTAEFTQKFQALVGQLNVREDRGYIKNYVEFENRLPRSLAGLADHVSLLGQVIAWNVTKIKSLPAPVMPASAIEAMPKYPEEQTPNASLVANVKRLSIILEAVDTESLPNRVRAMIDDIVAQYERLGVKVQDVYRQILSAEGVELFSYRMDADLDKLRTQLDEMTLYFSTAAGEYEKMLLLGGNLMFTNLSAQPMGAWNRPVTAEDPFCDVEKGSYYRTPAELYQVTVPTEYLGSLGEVTEDFQMLESIKLIPESMITNVTEQYRLLHYGIEIESDATARVLAAAAQKISVTMAQLRSALEGLSAIFVDIPTSMSYDAEEMASIRYLQRPSDVYDPGFLEGEYTVKGAEGMGDAVSEELTKIPGTSAAVTEKVAQDFRDLKREVVGASIIPEMVELINLWLNRIGMNVYGPENVGKAFLRTKEAVERAYMIESSGVPGGGTQKARDEILKQLAEKRAIAEDASVVAEATLSRADPGQWQYLTAPGGMRQAPVPPEFVYERAGKEVPEGSELATGLEKMSDAEKEVHDAANKTARALFDQTKVAKDKITILHELAAGTMSASEAEERIAKMTEEAGDSMEKTSMLANRFFRHITWILQGIVVWGAIRAFQNLAREASEAFKSMEFSAAQAAFVTGESINRIMAQQREYANMTTQYGIEPAQVAPAVTIAERFGMNDPQIMEHAAQLSMITGEQVKMEESTHAILSVMRQWNISAEESGRIMNVLATLYKTTPGSMQDFMSMMQLGPALADQMGQSFEENALLIGRIMSYLPEESATAIRGTLGRLLTRVYEGASVELAQRFGISTTETETGAPRAGLEVLDEIAAAYQSLRTEAEKAAFAEMVAGTRQGTSWQNAYVILENWQTGIRGVNMELSNADDLIQSLMDTNQLAGEAMTATWGEITQSILQGLGVMQAYKDLQQEITEGASRFSREQLLYGEAREKGYSKEDLYRMYEKETGERGVVRASPSGGVAATEEYLKWIENMLAGVQEFSVSVDEMLDRAKEMGLGDETTLKLRYYLETGEESRGQPSRDFLIWLQDLIPDIQDVSTGIDDMANSVKSAGDDFNSSVRNASQYIEASAEEMRQALLAARLAAGWTPGTGITDLTDYTMPQIEQALQASTAEGDRLVSEYRRFLQQEGFGETAVDKYTKELTDKMQLQLQFYRLPGNEIKLMEGRDLLFYLSQIEENTRPLEGIWNVPEGMRVWVPIESTFYGEWRNRQAGGGATEAGAVSLDSSQYDTSTDEFGMYVDKFGVAVGDYQSISDAIGTAFPYTDAVTGEYVAPPPTLTPETNWGDAASQLSGLLSVREEPTPYDIYLPTIIRGVMENAPQLYPEVDFPEINLPTPMPVAVQSEQMAQAQALGMTQTGMPNSMASMRLAMSSMAGAIASQIYYLMIIASNTGQTPTVTVEGTSDLRATAEPVTPAAPMSSPASSWYMSGASGIVPN